MPHSRILLGVIGRPHGVRGLLRVASYTAEPSDLTAYGTLSDAADPAVAGRSFTLAWQSEGTAEVFEITGGRSVKVSDRDAAALLTNTKLYVDRERLPPAGEEEFYLSDLIGLEAVDPAGIAVGRVVAVHDYGAGPSLEIGRDGQPLLLAFTRASVPRIDLEAGRVHIAPPDEILVPDNDNREAAE